LADVISVIKIYPKDILSDFTDLINKISSNLPSRYKLLRYETEDLAYGYKTLRLFIVFPEDTEGGTEEIENLLKKLDEVEEVEVELVTRVF